MRNFILYSTIFSLFSEAILVNYVIDLKIFYAIIFLNFLLISFHYSIKISRDILKILYVIFFTGVISILIGTDSFSRLISQFLGIAIISLYYYNFFEIRDRKITFYFKVYCDFAFNISIIGILIFIYNLVLTKEIVPLKSIMLEPAHYVAAVLPACYYWFKHRELKKGFLKFTVIFVAIILSFSSLGLLGIMLGIFLLPRKINILRLIVPLFVGIIVFLILLDNVPSFSLRVKDTTDSFINKDLSGANLSSYALISNLFVAKESFEENPLIGGGLGSHIISHERIIGSVKGSENFGDMITLNAQDANSLFLRVVSELGLVGIFLVLSFIYKFYTDGDENRKIISRSILIYFFCKLLREGHYFSPEMYFFILAYWYNNKEFIFEKLQRQKQIQIDTSNNYDQLKF